MSFRRFIQLTAVICCGFIMPMCSLALEPESLAHPRLGLPLDRDYSDTRILHQEVILMNYRLVSEEDLLVEGELRFEVGGFIHLDREQLSGRYVSELLDVPRDKVLDLNRRLSATPSTLNWSYSPEWRSISPSPETLQEWQDALGQKTRQALESEFAAYGEPAKIVDATSYVVTATWQGESISYRGLFVSSLPEDGVKQYHFVDLFTIGADSVIAQVLKEAERAASLEDESKERATKDPSNNVCVPFEVAGMQPASLDRSHRLGGPRGMSNTTCSCQVDCTAKSVPDVYNTYCRDVEDDGYRAFGPEEKIEEASLLQAGGAGPGPVGRAGIGCAYKKCRFFVCSLSFTIVLGPIEVGFGPLPDETEGVGSLTRAYACQVCEQGYRVGGTVEGFPVTHPQILHNKVNLSGNQGAAGVVEVYDGRTFRFDRGLHAVSGEWPLKDGETFTLQAEGIGVVCDPLTGTISGADQLALVLQCRPENSCGDQESLSSSTHQASVTPHFADYQGEDVDGSMTVTLTENPDSANPTSQSVTIQAPGEVTAFPTQLQACSTFEASISQGGNMRCSVVPMAGQVNGPVELDAYCIEMPGDICEINPFFCELQPPDGSGTGQCTALLGSTRVTVNTYRETPTGVVLGVGEIWVSWAILLCPGGQLDGSLASALTTMPEEPVLYLRNADGSIYAPGDTIEVLGVARHQGQGLAPSVFLNGEPVTLANFQSGLQDDDTCSEQPSSGCTSLAGFRGDLDLSGLSAGTHRLSVSVEQAEAAAFQEIEFTIGSATDGGAEVVSHSLPTAKSCGEAWTSTVTMKNTGTETWTSEGCYKLAPVGDSDPFAGFSRFALPGGVSVPPDGEVTFSIPMTAPAVSGTFTTDWRMVSEAACGGDGWFGETASSTATLDCVKDARVVSHTLPASMTCGESTTATIVLENTGSAVWREGQLYYLGARGGSDPFSPQQTYGLADPEVLPGETVSVDVQLNAGSAMSGTYTSDWGMYHNGSGFGHAASSQVEVSCIIDDATVVSHTIPAVMTCSETVNASLTMRNTGTTTWSYADGAGYVLAAPTSDPLRPGAPYWFPLPSGVAVAPQQSYTWTVPLTAPEIPNPIGAVTSWRLLKTGSGNFGETLFGNVDIECPGDLEVSGPTGLLQDGDTLSLGSTDASVVIPFAVELCNRGTSHIVITPKGSPRFIYGTGFFGTVDPDRDLPAGACTSIGGYFQAGAAGNYSGYLQFDTTTQEEPFDIALQAVVDAPPPPEIRVQVLGSTINDGGSYTFPDIEVPPGGSHEVDFQICNDGQSALEVNPHQLTGDVASFLAFTPPPATIQPGACGSLPVTFSTSFTGDFSAVLVIPNNDPDEGSYQVNLTGRGIPRP